MTFLENFERQCAMKGVTPSHALESAGLSRSLYSKWKHNPERPPYGHTVTKLAEYFGCAFADLDPNGRAPRRRDSVYNDIVDHVAKMDSRDREHLLSYIRFTYFNGET